MMTYRPFEAARAAWGGMTSKSPENPLRRVIQPNRQRAAALCLKGLRPGEGDEVLLIVADDAVQRLIS
jgi:hypothetical protein